MKREWRKIIEDHKMRNPASTSLDKIIFPRLLSKLNEEMGMKVPQNLISGFRACGIVPLDAETVLKKYPAAAVAENERRVAKVPYVVLEYLQKFKYSPGGKQTPRVSLKKVNIEPGKSITAADLASASAPQASSSVGLSAASSSSSGPSAASRPALPKTTSSTRDVSADEDSDSEDFSDDSEEEWQPPRKAPRNVFRDF
ncbi:Pogo transposable element with KRAB domain [Elysia marginata]|uniref:Pogo transposable element with KRAB domain n=1 Tax=Elysia marginata TaxID=1093978 RepID=A0AAV4JM07_9GAST|nr:Pogo transposable element with KRAB domain [Elysia marginata]